MGRIGMNVRKHLEKFKYPALILLLGLGLILWPSKTQHAEPSAPPEPATESVEAQMEQVLSCVDGAGKVRVMLTKRTGDETVYQIDEALSQSDGREDTSRTTVIARADGGGDAPVVRQTVYGAYRGALIVSEGADSAQVRLSLVNAVAGLTGLPTDRITVIKMKE